MTFLKLSFQNESKRALVRYMNGYVLASAKNTLSNNVTQGDFGEMLAATIVSSFEHLKVPLCKLRWKLNKNKSLFCTDLIAHNTTAKIVDIYYYEVKTRAIIRREKPSKKQELHYVGVNAHNALEKDEESPSEGIADFLSRYFESKGDYENALRYAEIVKHPEKFKKHFELFFVIEKSQFIEEILAELDEMPPRLTPLRVTIVLFKDLKTLVLETQKKTINEAIKHVFG